MNSALLTDVTRKLNYPNLKCQVQDKHVAKTMTSVNVSRSKVNSLKSHMTKEAHRYFQKVLKQMLKLLVRASLILCLLMATLKHFNQPSLKDSNT